MSKGNRNVQAEGRRKRSVRLQSRAEAPENKAARGAFRSPQDGKAAGSGKRDGESGGTGPVLLRGARVLNRADDKSGDALTDKRFFGYDRTFGVTEEAKVSKESEELAALELAALKQRNLELAEGLNDLQQWYSNLSKEANPYATVVEAREKFIVVDYGGKKIEALPLKGVTLKPGQTVKLVGNTLQILSAVEDYNPWGEVVIVPRVVNDKTGEIDRAGSARAVNYHGTIEEGDRVIVD